MKKSLMILASVALGASMASAQNVESKNIVGFGQADGVNPGFWLVGCNFQTMAGGDSMSIHDLFPAEELYADPDGDPDVSDQIMVFDGSVYTTYVFCDFDEPGDPQWWEGDFSAPSTKSFARGDGFWFKRADASTATTLTVNGQVPTNASVAHVDLPVGFFVMAYAYPNVTPLNDLGISAYADPDGNPDVSDQIMVFDGAVYTTYVFCDFDEPGDPQWWEGDFSAPTSFGLPVGGAAWYNRSADAGSSATWTENKPY
jgi:hypothetical protein